MACQLSELAKQFGLELSGPGDIEIDGVCSLRNGGPTQLGFLADSRFRDLLERCNAGAVILRQADLPSWSGPALISDNPQTDFARIAALFDPIKRPESGIHSSASVDGAAVLGKNVSVGANAVIEAGSQIGDEVIIGPGCVIGKNVSVGNCSWLTANVTLYDGVTLGERVHIQPGASIGGRGFGLSPRDGEWVEVPQLGSVTIGNDVEIGANSCIDRGALDDTVIEEGVKIDNLVQIGHNSRIGAHTAIAGCAGISGSSIIGKRCQIGGAVGIAGHLQIADDVIITGYSLVSSSITEPGVYSSGIPVTPARDWRRQVARLRNIDELAKRVKTLEKTGGDSGE